MTHGSPERAATRGSRSTASGTRRRRALFGGLLALALGASAFTLLGHLLTGLGSVPAVRVRVPSDTGRVSTSVRTDDGISVTWPAQGQAAIVVGGGRPAASPDEQPVPIASLAKVMTAYLTLERYPLSGTQDGFAVTVTAAQAQEEADDAAENQSGVAVAAGERLTERQLLEALLIPSGNNIARMLAARVAGSEARFLAEMNAEARALGMDETTYTDPSGFDPSTVSTAADQLRLFRRAMRFGVFREIVSTAAVTLPVAGTLTNFNPLIAQGYAGKTGSDSAAGGCLAFFTTVMVGRRPLTAVGVVMGQGEGNDTSGLLSSAAAAAEALVASAAPGGGVRARPAPGLRDLGGGRRQLRPPLGAGAAVPS